MSAKTVVVARVKSADVSRKGTGVQDNDVGSYRTLQVCGVWTLCRGPCECKDRFAVEGHFQIVACLDRTTHPFPN
jgi:hypothetical protein